METKYQGTLKKFALFLAGLEVLFIFLYSFYVRIDSTITSQTLESYYPWFQDVNVMMMIGFGYLLAVLKRNSWTALGFTLLMNAVAVQEYFLFQGFWKKVISTGFIADTYLRLTPTLLIQSSFASAAVLISYGAVIGRVGPLELMIMTVVEIVGYALTERVIYGGAFTAYDIGGSMGIHIYGAYFGLICSYIVGRKQKITTKRPSSNYMSCVFAMIGTQFLWVFWPSFNSGTQSNTNDYQRTLIVTNTVLSLTGSVISTFAFSILLRGKFSMDDILNATLAGGVAIGAPSSLITNPAAAIAIGIFAGAVSTYGFAVLLEKQSQQYHCYDTVGIHYLHAIPGMIGGLSSAVIIANYSQNPLNIGSATVDFAGGNYLYQGGIQVAGTFTACGIGLVFGIVAGYLINIFYEVESGDFFDDAHFWEVPAAVTAVEDVKMNQVKE